MADERLADACEVIMGQSPPGDSCNDDAVGLPLLNGPTEYGPYHPSPVQFTTDARKRANAGDVLFCVRGSTTGRMNWADQEYAIGRGVAAIRHKTDLTLQPFVRAVIEFGLPTLLAQATGSTFPNVSADQLASLSWPPLQPAEQRAIAHILGTLDDKIELNRRMNETLEAMARALFKSWFIDFDPVIDNALAAGNPIPAQFQQRAQTRKERLNDPNTPKLPDPIRTLFPKSFQDSPLGPIPKDWNPGTLGDVADLNPETWSKSNRPKSVLYVDLSNTKWGRIESTVSYASADAPSRAQRVLRPGDTIFGTVRPGNGSFALISEQGLTGSTGFAVLRPRRIEDRDFVYLAATEHENVDRLTRLADGAAYPAVRPDVVAATGLCVPPAALRDAFSQAAAGCQDRIAAAQRESRTLATLRGTLLPKLISGDLRLENPDQFLTEAE